MKVWEGSPNARAKRRKRVRARIFGTAKKPRLCVFRSGKHIFAQLIDDARGVTLASASDLEPKFASGEKTQKRSKSDAAHMVGQLLAKKSVDAGIRKVIFDRAGYRYHGRVRRLAEGAREAGLVF